MHSNTQYRPEIDGLRAIAVLLVILNHVGFSTFSGGFIGVDVFFVISGYLITGITFGQLNKGTFTFKDFYIRRARRILPAFYVMLLAVLVAGYMMYLPSDLKFLAESAISSISFASNIFFSQNSGGYFSPNAEELPLLHIWSLSVEEQFYFLWPLALFFIVRVKSFAVRAAIIILALFASFALAEYGIGESWGGTYFLLQFRAGELLVGGLLAFLLADRKFKPNYVIGNIASFIGLLLIAIPAFYLDKSSRFPGVNALIPCLGAALIIASTSFGKNIVSQILSTRPFVFVGIISYSLYLWHWPLISFLHYSRVEITSEIATAIIATALLLGYLSWRFVEQTFRHKRVSMNRMLAFSSIAAALAIMATPIVLFVKDGVPSRFPFALMTEEQLNVERSRYWAGIETKKTKLVTTTQRKTIIIGNSHAYDFSYALTENDFSGKIKLIETTFHCFNFGHDAVFPEKKEYCHNLLSTILASPDLKAADDVYLHDNWGGESLAGLEEMIASIRKVTNAHIYVVGPKMTFTDTALNISKIAQQQRYVTAGEINEFAKKFEKTSLVAYDSRLKVFFSEKQLDGVTYISALNTQCGLKLECNILSSSGEYLYFDDSHFTLVGSRAFGKLLKESNSALF